MEAAAWILTPLTFLALLALERLRPGRPLPTVPRWYAKGTAWFAGVAIAYLVVVPMFASDRLPALAAPAAFVLADAITWAIHRAAHRNRWLWRWTHQLHHSAERVDVAGALYLHPLDVVLQLAALVIAVIALGLPRGGAAVAAYLVLAAQMFVHVNVRTPQWLGTVLQRPEAHAVHHTREVHAYNYGLLTIWDRLAGTFRNPRSFTTEPAGFGSPTGDRT